MESRQPGRRRPSLQSRAKWLVRSRPGDYLLAMSEFYAGLPLVGKYFEPFGGITAMGVWGYRHAPGFVSAAIRSRNRAAAEQRRQHRMMTNDVAAAALKDFVSPARQKVDWPAPDRLAPVLRGVAQRRRQLHKGAVRYGDAPGQVLDVWRRSDSPASGRDPQTGPAPVLVFVPGGAWVHGSRMVQGYTLLNHLAEQGWVCLSIDYRVSPHHRWPRHVTDVKAAVAWARANVDRFGGTATSSRSRAVRPGGIWRR